MGLTGRPVTVERTEREKKLQARHREDAFCELIARTGMKPGVAADVAGYAPEYASRLMKRKSVKEKIKKIMDTALSKVAKNDVRLAKLDLTKGEHLIRDEVGAVIGTVPASVITDAKNRVYDRSSLGPVVKESRSAINLGIGIANLTPKQREERDSILAEHYGGTAFFPDQSPKKREFFREQRLEDCQGLADATGIPNTDGEDEDGEWVSVNSTEYEI